MSGALKATSLNRAIQNAVLASISEPSFSPDFPKLSPEAWERVSIHIPEYEAENERLEFLGDALMYACIGMELYKQIPDGSPHMYTQIRGALHANLTFCHLLNKTGVKVNGNAKSLGDILETVMGAYYTERGFDALFTWVRRTYEPIIPAAVEAFHKFETGRGTNGGTKSGKNCGAPDAANDGTQMAPAGSPQRRKKSSSSATLAEPGPSLRTQRRRSRTAPSGRSSSTAIRNLSSAAGTTGKHHSGASLQGSQEITAVDCALPHQAGQTPRPFANLDALPPGWEAKQTRDGQTYFINHNTRSTTWDDPREIPHIPSAENDYGSPRTAFTTDNEDPPVFYGDEAFLFGPSIDHAAEDHEFDGVPPFPELLEEGYTLDPSPPGIDAHVSQQDIGIDALPGIWEIREAFGVTFFIEHIAGIVTRRDPRS